MDIKIKAVSAEFSDALLPYVRDASIKFLCRHGLVKCHRYEQIAK